MQAMEEKIVRASFSVRLGIRAVELGQYLPPGTAVTTLQARDPIYVDFSVPQQQVGDIRPGRNSRPRCRRSTVASMRRAG